MGQEKEFGIEAPVRQGHPGEKVLGHLSLEGFEPAGKIRNFQSQDEAGQSGEPFAEKFPPRRLVNQNLRPWGLAGADSQIKTVLQRLLELRKVIYRNGEVHIRKKDNPAFAFQYSGFQSPTFPLIFSQENHFKAGIGSGHLFGDEPGMIAASVINQDDLEILTIPLQILKHLPKIFLEDDLFIIDR
jgi:hypothetical protein